MGLSPSPCLIRVKRLETGGLYRRLWRPDATCKKLGDFADGVHRGHARPSTAASDFSRFETAIRKIDEIIECHLVSGGYDYLLEIRHPRRRRIIRRSSRGLLERDLGIEKYFSYIVIKSPFIKYHYPIQGLFGGIVRPMTALDIDDLIEPLVAFRRDIHAHPELGFCEHRTSAQIAAALELIGIEVHRGIGGTGLVGVLRTAKLGAQRRTSGGHGCASYPGADGAALCQPAPGRLPWLRP